MLTKGAFTNQFLFISLCALCLLVLGELVVAQKGCTNGASGQVYIDANYSDIFEPDEQRASGGTISIHARATGKTTIYESTDGTFTTGDIACDIYDVKFNDYAIGYFEISEVVSPLVHSFPITPEVLQQSTVPLAQPYRVYLPVVTR